MPSPRFEAVVNVKGESGERQIKFEDFHHLPEDTPNIDNNLRVNEIITSIDLPEKGCIEHHAYLKLRDRTSYDGVTACVFRVRQNGRWNCFPMRNCIGLKGAGIFRSGTYPPKRCD